MKILFFTSQTGGGHMSVAKALAEELKEKYGIESYLPDFFLEATKKPFADFPKNYSQITKDLPFFWGFLWYFTYPRWWYHFLNKIVEFFTPTYLEEFFRRYPDINAIISVHPLLNHFPFLCAKKFYKDIKFIIVGIEFLKYHTSWFQKEADLIIYPFLPPYFRYSSPIGNLPTYFGIPLRKEFDVNYNKEELRRKYEIGKDRKIILILGGSEGWGKISKIVKEVYLKRDYYLICVCGRNQQLFNQLRESFANQERVKIFSYVEEIAELFAISDVAILKAGAISLAEAIACQVPIIIYHYLYGQELGNLQFITKNKLGFYSSNLKELLLYLDKILLTDLGEKLRENLRKFKDINGRERIVKFIVDFLRSR